MKGEQYIVLDDSQDHWWQVENSEGEVGFIPSNYVKKFDDLGLTSFDWYVGDMSRQRAESLLKSEDKAEMAHRIFSPSFLRSCDKLWNNL